MRVRLLSLSALAAAAFAVHAAPPAPHPDFAQPQSPTRPAPFPVRLVDQGRFDPRLKGYLLPDGFKLEIVLAEPDVVNPVGMTFGPDGTLYVIEWKADPVGGTNWFEVKDTFRYRDGSTRQVATMRKFVLDQVKQFKPNPAGTFEKPKPIIADELPSSVLYHDGWLYLSGRGTVRRYRQSKPNGNWDVRETIAQGFCGFHHHQVSGLTIGNDGLLYITTGDDDNHAEGSDGSRATALRTGAVFRCRPDGANLELFSVGYRNPYRDLCHDDRFNWFHADNDNEDGSRFMGCRLVHVAEGVDYGWRLRDGVRCCRPDLARGAVAGELPGKLPPMLKTGRGAPAGLLAYHDTQLPERYRGLLFYPDVYRKLVRAYSVEPDGASFRVSHEFEFLKSDDPLFRPCQMVTGPDGAIYVCDWRTDSGGAGKLFGDGAHGRVYRITWAGTADEPAIPRRPMDTWARLSATAGATVDAVFEGLQSDDLTTRVQARRELVRRVKPKAELRPEEAGMFADAAGLRGKLLAVVRDADQPPGARLAAVGALSELWSPDLLPTFTGLLRDDAADVRRLAADALGLHAKADDEKTHEALLKALADRDPAVRRAVALALGRQATGGAADALLAAWKGEENPDPFLKDAYLRGVERLGAAGVNALLALASSGDNRDRDFAVDAFLMLRERPGADALSELLANPHLAAVQREALIRSFGNYLLDPPVNLDPLPDFLARRPGEPEPVMRAALEAFTGAGSHISPKGTAFVVGMLAAGDAETRLTAIRASEDARLAAAAPKLLELLADAGRDLPERAAVLKALRTVNHKPAVDAVRGLLARPEPAPLKVEALRTLAALDPAGGRAAAEALLDQADPALLAEAAAVLGATKPGAVLVATRYVAGKLPRDLFPQVSASLRNFITDPAVAALNAEVMKGGLKLTLQPAQVEKIRQLVETKGDPKRGKDVYLNTKLLACATCHRLEGVGGSVGPDLSRVWDTHSVEKLLESIVEPSKEIKEGFQAFRAVSAGGQVFVGLRVAETAKDFLLRDAAGRDVRIPKDELEAITPTRASIMPDDSVARLTFDQLIDLLAFLKSRGHQESLRGSVLEYGVAGPFPGDLKAERPEVKADPAGGVGAWKTVAADPTGVADLKPLFPAQPGGVYARVYVFSPKPQSATGVLLADDPLRVWVNDARVYERGTPKAEPFAAEETFEVALKAGWNVVLVKSVNAAPAHRLGLRLVGDGLRPAVKPDVAGGG